MQASTRSTLRRVAIAAALVAGGCGLAQAAAFEFADFNLVNASQPVSFTNNGGTSASLSFLNVPVSFNFTVQSGLPTGDHQALLSITGGVSTFAPASMLPGGLLLQPLSNPMTLSIIEIGSGANLLSMTFTGEFVGRGPNASIFGSDTGGEVVSFSSAFGSFAAPGNSYTLGLGTLSPVLGIGAGGFLSSFVANINGQFSADFTAAAVPEPATPALFFAGIVAVAGLASRRWQGARQANR